MQIKDKKVRHQMQIKVKRSKTSDADKSKKESRHQMQIKVKRNQDIRCR